MWTAFTGTTSDADRAGCGDHPAYFGAVSARPPYLLLSRTRQPGWRVREPLPRWQRLTGSIARVVPALHRLEMRLQRLSAVRQQQARRCQQW